MLDLRAKEIAALTVGNLFDDTGAVREQFVLDASQTKGAKTRTVWINAKLRRQLEQFRKHYYPNIQTMRCSKVKRVGRLVQIQ
jgi:integrase